MTLDIAIPGLHDVSIGAFTNIVYNNVCRGFLCVCVCVLSWLFGFLVEIKFGIRSMVNRQVDFRRFRQ